MKAQPARYYNFVLRVAKYFQGFLKKDKDPLHAERSVLCKMAVRRAMAGVDPKSQQAMTPKSVQTTFLPIMEALFELPGKGAREGSHVWIDDQVKHIDKVSFHTMTLYPRLLKAYILLQLGSDTTDEQGCPWLEEGETVRKNIYNTCYANHL